MNPDTTPPADHARAGLGTALRLAGAAAVLVSGLLHLKLYFDEGYRDIPVGNIGRQFLAHAVVATLVAAALVVRRDPIVRLAGAGLMAASLGAFALSRTDSGLFGFTETGWNPTPWAAVTVIAEVAGLLLLGATLVPSIGGGEELDPRAALGGAGATVAVAVVAGALWAQSPDEPETVATDPTEAPDPTNAPDMTGMPGMTTVPASAPAGGTATTAGGSAAPAGETVTIDIADFAFSQPALEIPVGTTVTWTNQDGAQHNVVANDGSFKSETLASGDEFTFTFETAGEFAYICSFHPFMTATVTVTA